jgi:hypothetical protein
VGHDRMAPRLHGPGNHASLPQLEGRCAQLTSKASDAHCIHQKRALDPAPKGLTRPFYPGFNIQKVATKTTTATADASRTSAA